MRCYRILAVLCVLIASPAFAGDEGIPAAKLSELKAATVYVKVTGNDGTATGSGFLVATDGESGFVVTNHHVVGAAAGGSASPKIALIFWSGTKKELVLPAELLASDPVADLAVLRTTAKNLPAALDPSHSAEPRETMTVYTLGFPLGERLSPSRTNPAVTIGKGTVSSLRQDQRGKLTSVQLDGELNPGNSGGPIIDGDGKLLGVAVSKIVGTRIGFAIPAAELNRLLQGRTAGVLIQSMRVDNGTAECDIEVPCVDPFRKIRTIQLRWSRKDAQKEVPAAGSDGAWHDLPGALTMDLKVEGGVGKGKVTLKCADRTPVDYLFQTAYDNGGGKSIATQPLVRAIDFRVTGVVRSTDAKNGLGYLWEVVTSKEGGFTIDMPAKPTIETTRTRQLGGNSGSIKIHLVGCETQDGLYLAQKLELPTAVAQADVERLHDAVRDSMAEDWNGKVTSEKKVRAEGKSGRDFTIRSKPAGNEGVVTARVRQYFVGKAVFVVMVVSTPNHALPVDAGRFLGSLALGDRKTRAAGTPEPEPRGTELAGWGLAIDPDKDCKFRPEEKTLSVEVPGTQHDLNPDSGKLNAPRVMREVEGDFTTTVKVAGEFRPGGKSTNPKGVPYNGAGIVIWSDADNFIRLERGAMARGAKIGTYVAFEEREGGYRGAVHNEVFQGGNCFLRVVRKGSRIRGAVSTDGKKWKELKPIDTVWPAKLRVGLTAINSSSEAFTARFEEFEFKAGTPAAFAEPARGSVDKNVTPTKDAPRADEEAPTPPAGWKDFTTRDHAFTVWVPEKAKRQLERERTSAVGGHLLKVTSLHVELADGCIYHVEKLTFPAALHTKLKRPELEDALKEMLVAEFRGKLTDESEVKLGALTGKEYLIETGKGLARARVFVSGGGRALILHAEGTKEQVQDKGTQVFLDSCRLGSGKARSAAEASAKKNSTKIVGGTFDPEFTDTAPEGGLLVGFEIGLGTFANNDIITAARPIYRVDGKDSLGKQYGTDTSRVVKVLAKPGYAVGSLSAKAALYVNGISVTFMKVVDKDRLDPKDSYESEWIGGKRGREAVRLGGEGTPVIGIVGKSNQKDMTGLGLKLMPPAKGP